MKQDKHFRDVYFDGLLTGACTYFKMEEINSLDFEEQSRLALRPSELNPIVFTFWGRILGTLFPVKAEVLCRSIADVLSRELKLGVKVRFLRSRLSTIYWQVKLYRVLLRRIRPRVVLVSDTGEYALRIAADREKIPFVELQHGVFDLNHPDAIPDWVPGSTPELILPDILATRGRYWIERLSGTRQYSDAAVPVGNELVDEARMRRKNRQRSDHVDLVLTSQGLDTERLVCWIKAMASAAPSTLNWRLSIKLHPVYDQNPDQFANIRSDERIRLIKGADLPNVFDLLADADLHLSIASACHFDAAALGVRTVVLPLAGHEMLLPAVDSIHVFLAMNPADVWEIIELPVTFGEEETYRFSEPGFVNNMRKLLVHLERAAGQSRSTNRGELANADV
ncbi:hypothetical protein [Bradyrhizobium guangdongense]